MKIQIVIDGDYDDVIETTLAEFAKDNELEPTELADIKAALNNGLTYLGGGGAAVGFEITKIGE